jgi:hypothetical protein
MEISVTVPTQIDEWKAARRVVSKQRLPCYSILFAWVLLFFGTVDWISTARANQSLHAVGVSWQTKEEL